MSYIYDFAIYMRFCRGLTKILFFYLERVHLQSILGKALQRLGQ